MKGGDCLRGGNGVVRWNRGGKQRTTGVMLLRHCWAVGAWEVSDGAPMGAMD